MVGIRLEEKQRSFDTNGEVAYITSAYTHVLDADDDIVWVFDFRYRSVFVLDLPWTV